MTRAEASRDLLAAIFAGDTRRVARLDAIYQSTGGGVPAATSPGDKCPPFLGATAPPPDPH